MKRMALGGAVCLAIGLGAGGVQADQGSTPAPAAMAEVAITSAGARLNAIVYLAAGAGPKPVVVFLHGYPGNEKNLDLAQAVRRAGYDAVYTDYRGIWGSGGTFSFGNALDDAKAVLAWVRAPETAQKYGFDPARIAVVGHSFGGWLALMTAASEPPQVCIAGLAAWNVGWAGQRLPSHADERTAALDDFRNTTAPGAPVHASADDLLNEMTAHAAAWNYLSQADRLGNRALLLVAASRDSADEDVAMHEQLARALRAAGNRRVKMVSYDDDHPFSTHRLELAALLTNWLKSDCASSQASARP